MATYLAPVPFRLKNKYLNLQTLKVRERVLIGTDVIPILLKRFLNRFLGVDDFYKKRFFKTFCSKNYWDEKATFQPLNGHYQAK